MKRFPAFTLMETLLALLLMAIVGGMATVVMQHVGQGTVRAGQRHASESEWVELNVALRADHARAEGIEQGPGGGICFSSERDTTCYIVLSDSSVQRTADGSTQVFQVKAMEWERRVEPGTDLVNRWHLHVSGEDEHRALVLTHTYLIADRVVPRAKDGHPHSH